MSSTETIGALGTITVDYGTSLQAMIAAGNYDWVNPNITAERFPVVGKGIVRFKPKLFDSPRYISSEHAVAAMKKEKFTPATHVHGLAFGATFPDEQRKYLIVCLGSSAQVLGDRRVVYLCRRAAGRYLDLSRWGGFWDGFWRLLAVQQLSAA